LKIEVEILVFLELAGEESIAPGFVTLDVTHNFGYHQD